MVHSDYTGVSEEGGEKSADSESLPLLIHTEVLADADTLPFFPMLHSGLLFYREEFPVE